MVIPTDPLYASQWHFPLLGDIETIWDEYTGAGVNVGVYDDGVEYTHPDLSGNYDPSLHFVSGGTTYDPMPIASGDGHGTAVAGIIGATDGNGIGGVGVAHGATLTGVNFLGDIQFVSFALALESMEWARNFDIMSNSWGRTPEYQTNQSLANPSSSRALFNIEYGEAAELGRGGLGTVIVQAAGNDTLNANGDGLNATRFTATIAATDASGNVASYSNFGAAILVAAPAAAVTTDRQGTNGYNGSAGTAGDYTTTFGGTSAATPVVSGVIALMLEANPDLGWRDVQNILAISAAQTGSAFGGAGTGNEVGDWGTNAATNWNGGGMTFHASYGFGMVDAYAAVRMAEVWTAINDGVAATSANEETTSVSYGGAPITLPAFGVTDIPLVVTDDMRIEDIAVTVDMQHNFSSDLVISLIAPNGDEFLLMNQEGGNDLMDTGFNWTFGVTGALGTMSAGTWTLRIDDQATGDGGTLTDVTLEFFGAEDGDNDIYHYTDDLLDLIAVEGMRDTIEDTNGGSDWLNFAGMSNVNVTADLDNQLISFSTDPTALTIAPGTEIENVVTGDGNDTITGNALDNALLGMRGDDVISGLDGRDIILGGAGEDTIEGGSERDTIDGGAGADDIDGGTGSDYLDGGTDDDRVDGGRGHDTLRGGRGNDTLIGGIGYDSLLGDANDDVISGNEGNDTLRGGNGRDALFGDNGHDTLFGDNGYDTLVGGDDDDWLDGGRHNDELYGEAGNDTLIGGANDDYLDGGTENDLLIGGNGRDTMFGAEGEDTLHGDNGNDQMYGGNENDSLNGGNGNDLMYGDRGNDTLNGGDNDDRLYGGANDDDLRGDNGNDRLYGANGHDRLVGGDGDDTLLGENGYDRLYGQADNDILNGGRGNDTLDGGIGNDGLYGGANDDLLMGAGGDDHLFGGNGRDTLEGGNHSDVLLGEYGYDSLDGGAHNDTLDGGAHDDTLTGGTGSDVFVFGGTFDDDTITDFDAFDDDEIIDVASIGTITDYADLLANHMTQVGSDVVIDDDLGNTITIENVLIGNMNDADFNFFL